MAITPYLGLGLAPFGTVPFGFGAPALANPNVGKIFDNNDGTIGNNRLIDPRTRDYLMNTATGRIYGQDAMQQMVYLALVTVKESSSVNSLGENFSSIKQITPNVQAALTNEVKLAVNHLTTKKQIVLNNVFVQIDQNNVARIHVVWTDTSKNIQVTTVI